LTGTIDSNVTTDAIFTADGDVIQCGRTSGTVQANGRRTPLHRHPAMVQAIECP
jgi:hypothetical protein